MAAREQRSESGAALRPRAACALPRRERETGGGIAFRSYIRRQNALALCLTLFAVVAVCTAGGCKKEAGGGNAAEILVGEYGSLSGSEATFGQSTHAGIQLAVDEANDKGGVLGKKIVVKPEDDASNQDQAVSVVKKLINRDGVVAVLGEVASSNSLAGGGVCQNAKIPMITPSSTNPDVTRGKDHVFRVCFTDDFQARVEAKEAAKRGYKKVAVFTAVNSNYSVGLSRFFKETFAKSGPLVAEENYTSSDRDFKPQLSRIKEASPDAVYLPGYYTQIGLIVRQARELGLNVPFFGGDGWDGPDVFALGSQADGCWFTDHYSPDEDRPEVQAFVKAYGAKYHKTPDAMAVTGYDAANVLIDAIRRAGKAEPAAIRDAIAATKDFRGASGVITIDSNRNASKPIVVLELKGGKPTLAGTYPAEGADAGPTTAASVAASASGASLYAR